MPHPIVVLLQSSWVDGLSTWAKLVAVVVSVLIGLIGYKVNQELFKAGGVMERLEEMDKKNVDLDKEQVRLSEQGKDHERRIGELEKYRWPRR